MRPVGVVAGGRAEPDDDDWGGVEAMIVIDSRFGVEAVKDRPNRIGVSRLRAARRT